MASHGFNPFLSFSSPTSTNSNTEYSEYFTFETYSEVVIHTRISLADDLTSEKPLIVFLHDCCGSSSTWHKLTMPKTPTSLKSLYPTLSIDLRGSRKSPMSGARTEEDYEMSSLVFDVCLILQAIRFGVVSSCHVDLIRNGFVLVGYSMGAKVALTLMAIQVPYSVIPMHQLLKGLILVAPTPLTGRIVSDKRKTEQLAACESEEAVRWTLTNVLANPALLSDSDVELVVRDVLDTDQPAKRAWMLREMSGNYSTSVAGSFHVYHSLRVSVLVGEFDPIEPKQQVEDEVVEHLKRHGIPNVSLKIVPGVKHLIPFEDPASIYNEICQY